MEFRMGELFSGPGGLALGAKLAEFTDDTGEKWDFKHSWANDFDQDTVETYKLNLLHNPDAKTVFCEDVSKFPIGDKSILPDIDALAFLVTTTLASGSKRDWVEYMVPYTHTGLKY